MSETGLMAERTGTEAGDKVNVLLVDDQPRSLIALEAVLEALGQKLVRAQSGKEALKCLLEDDFAVILMDVQMPEMDGFETAALIRQRDRSRYTPIIFMTAYSRNDAQIARAYALGAVDFIFKPIVPDILRSKVGVFVELSKSKRQVERLNEDLKRHQRALEETIQRPRAVLETLAEAVVVVDAGGHVVLRNRMARELGELADGRDLRGTGEQQGHLLRLDGTLLPPEHVPIPRALRGERFSDDEVILVQPDGAARRLLVSGSAVHDSQGRVVLGTIVYRDVTELRDLAEAAQRRVAELQSVLDNMVDAVFVADVDGRISLANEAGVRMLGLPGAGSAGRELHEILRLVHLRRPDGTTIRSEDQPLARALGGESVIAEEEVALNAQTGRDIYLRVSATPIRNNKGEVVGAVAVARDVTELTELDRLKDQFVAVAAHELKTPVTIMKGYSQVLLRMNGELWLKRREMLESIDRGADRINSIVNSLLDISRLQIGGLDLATESVDVGELVGTVVDRVAPTAGRHRVRAILPERATVRGDRRRLEQVLQTLLDNAIRYSPAGGDIDVVVGLQGKEVLVSVADRGVGIPQAKQARIFQRFYRAHIGTPYDYGGMGVALYIAREIVERHGGRMWFESEEGKGSSFSFSLLRADTESAE